MKTNALLAASSALAALSVGASMPRAVHATPRADNADPQALFAQLQSAVQEMREKNDQSLAAKVDDTVLTEHVDRINADIGRIEEAMDKAMADIAAAKVGKTEQVRDPEYTEQFNAYFRSGVETARLNEVKAAATKTDGEGGFLAPIEWDRTVSGRLKQVSAMRQYASVQRISGAGFKKVFSDRNVGSGWVGETAARPATTTPGLASLDFPLGEIYANPAAS